MTSTDSLSMFNNYPHLGQLEPFVIQVLGPDNEIDKFKDFIMPFSSLHSKQLQHQPLHSGYISVKRKMNNNKTVHDVRFLISSPGNNNNGGGVFSSPSQHHATGNNTNNLRPQAFLVLCDSTDDDSLNRAAEIAQTVAEPQYPLIICDINTSTDSMEECEAARIDLASQLATMPEYCTTVPLATWSYPEETLAKHRHWSAEEHVVDFLCVSVVDSICFPKHFLWDGTTLTPQARKAIRRSFWMLDRDCDGLLSDAEIACFVQATYERPPTLEDIVEVKYFVEGIISNQIQEGADPDATRSRLLAPPPSKSNKSEQQEQQQDQQPPAETKDCYITVLGFFAVCHCMVSDARHATVWKLLSNHGIQPYNECRPWVEGEIENAVESFAEHVAPEPANTFALHLSDIGASFFASLYKNSRMDDSSTSSSKFDPTSLFLFTADCPWKTIYGLPDAQENHVSISDFVNCWKFMTQLDPATVAMFAKYWDFDGYAHQVANKFVPGADSSSVKSSTSSSTSNSFILRDLSSLFVPRKMRRFRKGSEWTPDVCIPPSASFLVFGSGGCGKTTLMQHIANPIQARQRQQQQIPHSPGRSVALVPIQLTSSQLSKQQQQDSSSTSSFPFFSSPTATTTKSSSNSFPSFSAVSSPTAGSTSSSLTKEILISLREPEYEEMEDIISDTAIMDGIDGVILCYDGNDSYSFGFIASILPKLAKRENLPIMTVMCKGDLPIEDQVGLNHSPEETCRSYGLPWPPTITSIVAPGEQLRKINNKKNEIDSIKMMLSELVLYPSLSCISGKRRVLSSNSNSNSNLDENAASTSSSLSKRRKRSSKSSSSVSTVATFIKRSIGLTLGVATCAYIAYYLDHKFHWIDRFVPPVAKENMAAAKDALPPGFRRTLVNVLTKTRDAVDVVVNDLMMKSSGGGSSEIKSGGGGEKSK